MYIFIYYINIKKTIYFFFIWALFTGALSLLKQVVSNKTTQWLIKSHLFCVYLLCSNSNINAVHICLALAVR